MNPTCRAGSGVALVVVLTLVDSACYMLIERRSFLDARAMTVITIATVGYEEVKPLDTAGRLFTIAIIFVGAARPITSSSRSPTSWLGASSGRVFACPTKKLSSPLPARRDDRPVR